MRRLRLVFWSLSSTIQGNDVSCIHLLMAKCTLKLFCTILSLCEVCSLRKYPCPQQGRLKEIPRGRGVPKAQFFERKYDTKMEFPEGWGFQTKKPSVGGVWIFSGTTQCTDRLSHVLSLTLDFHATFRV